MSLHHLSIQNFTTLPDPTLNLVLSLSTYHPPLIVFYTLTPYPSLTSLVHHHPSSYPYFPTITCFQMEFLSFTNLQNHPNKVLLRTDKFLMQKPHFLFFHATNKPVHQMQLASQSPPSPQKIPLNLFQSHNYPLRDGKEGHK